MELYPEHEEWRTWACCTKSRKVIVLWLSPTELLGDDGSGARRVLERRTRCSRDLNLEMIH